MNTPRFCFRGLGIGIAAAVLAAFGGAGRALTPQVPAASGARTARIPCGMSSST